MALVVRRRPLLRAAAIVGGAYAGARRRAEARRPRSEADKKTTARQGA